MLLLLLSELSLNVQKRKGKFVSFEHHKQQCTSILESRPTSTEQALQILYTKKYIEMKYTKPNRKIYIYLKKMVHNKNHIHNGQKNDDQQLVRFIYIYLPPLKFEHKAEKIMENLKLKLKNHKPQKKLFFIHKSNTTNKI